METTVNTCCGRCKAHVSRGAALRANGDHVVCPPRHGRSGVVIAFHVPARPSIPVEVRCGCADQILVETSCTCMSVTSCAVHGVVHHGSHD